EIHRCLARRELKRFSRMLALAFLFVLFALLGAALDDVEQIALFFLQVLLTIGPLLLAGVADLSALTATLSLTLSAAKSSASSGNGRSRRRRSSGSDL